MFLFVFLVVALLSAPSVVVGFCSSPTTFYSRIANGNLQNQRLATHLHVTVTPQDVASVGYVIKVSKPLGMILGENEGIGGVVVEDVEFGRNGAVAGIRAGDQLVSVNNDIVMGDAFETVMGLLKNGDDPLELRLFRGPVEDLYQTVFKTDDLDSLIVEDEEVIIDENYESPVVVAINEDDDRPLTAGDVMNALKKMSGMTDAKNTGEKKKGGFFGGMFSGETVQLDGDDANTLN
jgi:hypothetical protein